MNWQEYVLLPVAAAVIGWLVDAILGGAIKKGIRRGVHTSLWAVKKRLPLQRNTIRDFFISIGSTQYDRLDILIYQHGLRPKVPVIDYMYLTYIRTLLVGNEVDRVMIFPTISASDPRSELDPESLEEDFSVLKANSLKVFEEVSSDVTFVAPTDLPVPPPFSKSTTKRQLLRHAGSHEYLATIDSQIGHISIKDFSDFSRYHPKGDRLYHIVDHLFQALRIWAYLKQETDLLLSDRHIGLLLWEWEFDKVAAWHQLFGSLEAEVRVTSHLGRTVKYFTWAGLVPEYNPVPVFSGPDTLEVFAPYQEHFLSLGASTGHQKIVYARILRMLAESRYRGVSGYREASIEAFELDRSRSLGGQTHSYNFEELGFWGRAALHYIERINKE